MYVWQVSCAEDVFRYIRKIDRDEILFKIQRCAHWEFNREIPKVQLRFLTEIDIANICEHIAESSSSVKLKFRMELCNFELESFLMLKNTVCYPKRDNTIRPTDKCVH